MKVTYTSKAKREGEGYVLLQHATTRLEELLGPSAEGVEALWDMTEDKRKRPLYTLRISDWTGEASAAFAPDELQSPAQIRYRLHRLWGDLLQGRKIGEGRSLNELRIRGSETQLQQFMNNLGSEPRAEWKRDSAAEGRLGRMGLKGKTAFCLACQASDTRPAAAVWLHGKGPNELYVANIVPLEKAVLTEEEYNSILSEFNSTVVAPAAANAAVAAELVQHRTTLEQDLSPEGIRRLKAFSTAANKQALHPNDYQRWYAFVIQTHLEGAQLDPGVLERWLTEQGFLERECREIACEYESMRAMLLAYDEERVEKCPG